MAGPRIRTLKPEILEDEKTAALSDAAYRLFSSMIVLADDHGNVRADVRWLQGQIWWAHESPPNVLCLLVELARNSLINAYGVRGGTYVHLRGWEKHQRIDNAGKGRVPAPNDADAQVVCLGDLESLREPRRLAANHRDSRLDQEREWDQEREGDMDREGESEGKPDSSASPPPTKPAKRGPSKFQLPADWSPRAQERDRATGLGLSVDTEVESFRDHHTAKASVMADWNAAFRTWIGNAVRFGRANRTGKSPLELQLERVRMLEAEEARNGAP